MKENRLDQFAKGCLEAASGNPRARIWEWSFREDDFGREWHVTAREGTFAAAVLVYSARASPSSPVDVIEQLVRLLDEARAGNVS